MTESPIEAARRQLFEQQMLLLLRIAAANYLIVQFNYQGPFPGLTVTRYGQTLAAFGGDPWVVAEHVLDQLFAKGFTEEGQP